MAHSARDFGRGEVVIPDPAFGPSREARIDVLDVLDVPAGMSLDLAVQTDAFAWCPTALVVVRGPDGNDVARRMTQPEGVTIFGLKSGQAPCRWTGRVELPGIAPTDEIELEMYLNPESVRPDREPDARSGFLAMSELGAEVKDPNPPQTGIGEVQSSITGLVGPIVGLGLAAGGTWLLLTNLGKVDSLFD